MEITEYLPVDFRTQMEAETLCGAEEIRLRVGQPLEILYGDENWRNIGFDMGGCRFRKQYDCN